MSRRPPVAAPPAWDVVDRASADSFPASDPPGYYSVRASTNWPVASLERGRPDPAPLRARLRTESRWGVRAAIACVILASFIVFVAGRSARGDVPARPSG